MKAVETGTNLESAASAAFVGRLRHDRSDASPPASTRRTPTNAAPVLTWTASTDALSGVRRYQVLRGTTVLGTTSALTYTDATVSAAASYSYSVKAEDWAGNLSTGRPSRSSCSTTWRPRRPPASTRRRRSGRSRPCRGRPRRTPAARASDHYEVWRVGSPDVLAGSPTTPSFTDAADLDGGHVPVLRRRGRQGGQRRSADRREEHHVRHHAADRAGRAGGVGVADRREAGVRVLRRHRHRRQRRRQLPPVPRRHARSRRRRARPSRDTALAIDGSYSYRVSAARRGRQRVGAVERGGGRLRQDRAAGARPASPPPRRRRTPSRR